MQIQNTFTELYEILGVKVNAQDHEIKAAFREKAKQFHPDKNPNNPEIVAKEFQKCKDAYDILSNPIKRKKYDESGKTEYKDVDAVMFQFFNQHIFAQILKNESNYFERQNVCDKVKDACQDLMSHINNQKIDIEKDKAKIQKIIDRIKPKPGREAEAEHSKRFFIPHLNNFIQLIEQMNERLGIVKSIYNAFDAVDYSFNDPMAKMMKSNIGT